MFRSRAQGAARRKRYSVIVRADGDYYSVLGVSRDADKKAIKSAYRQLARKYHPDVNKDPGAEDRFKKIGEAYEVLSDDSKRQIYDRYGEAGLKGSAGFGGPGGPGVEFTNPFDIFESFFGGSMGGFDQRARASRYGPMPGEDERVDLQVDFLDAVFGCQRDIEVDRAATCKTCDGSGMKPGTSPSTCPECGGSGQVVSAVRTPLGMFQSVSTCNRCQGSGQISTPCDTCGGDGVVAETKQISLKIPAGVDTGSRLRVRGEGSAGRRGGARGDLYVYINVKEHDQLRRDGTTIHSDVDISYVDAILGSQVRVLTVDGPVELKIPPGTQPGTTLLMAKRGVPKLGSPNQRGDHQVHVRVTIPKRLSGEEKELVGQLKQLQEK